MLVSLETYAQRRFEASSRPHINTLRRWARRGKLEFHTEKRGRSWFVDLDRPKAESNNPLVSRVVGS